MGGGDTNKKQVIIFCMFQDFFRSMGLDDLDEEQDGTTPRLPPVSASTSNVNGAAAASSASGASSSSSSTHRAEASGGSGNSVPHTSKSMPQLAHHAKGGASSSSRDHRHNNNKDSSSANKNSNSNNKKDKKDNHKGAREKEYKVKQHGSSGGAREKDLESQASFSSKESGPSTTSSSTTASKGRSPDRDPSYRDPSYRVGGSGGATASVSGAGGLSKQKNVFADWAPAWKDPATTSTSDNGSSGPAQVHRQWPGGAASGSNSSLSHPARGSNPAIDILGLGLGRLGASREEVLKPRTRPGHANLGLRGDFYAKDTSDSPRSGGQPQQQHRPNSYHPQPRQHGPDNTDNAGGQGAAGDFYTRNPIGGREGVAIAGGRGQWREGDSRGSQPSISGESSNQVFNKIFCNMLNCI